MKQNKPLVYFYTVLAMAFWGMSYIWINIVYRAYNPITTVLLRLVIATPILYIFAKLVKKLQTIQREDRLYIISLGFLQPFLYFLFESFSLKLVSSTIASVVIATIPLFTPLAAGYLFKEKMSKLNIIGMFTAFFGVLLVILKGDFSFSASPFGLLLLFLAVIVGIAYTMLLKKVGEKYNAITIVVYQDIVGIICFLPLFLLIEFKHFLNASPNMDVFISLGLLALLPTTFSYVLYANSVKELGASQTSMFTNSMPVFTAIFAWLILHDSITLRMIIGICTVITGLFISQLKFKEKTESLA